MRLLRPDDAGITAAARLIARGEIVAYPTETVYGLGADPFDVAALRRLFEVKGRDAKNPVLLIVSDMEQLREIAGEISDEARQCMRRFWPGPLSLLLPKSPRLPEYLTAGHGKIGVRQTADPIAVSLCRAVGHAVTSTSANKSGEPPVRVLAELKLEGVAAGIDAGEIPVTAPSTVFDPDEHVVVRVGAITPEELTAD
jgi:L-threonylcarbamoyladenylate synthase